MSNDKMNRVWVCGCRAPDDERTALQLLGQAWLYREDLRHVYNRHMARARARWEADREASHVLAYEVYEAAHDACAHVMAYRRCGAWGPAAEERNADIRAARAARGHLLDAGTYWLVEEAIAQAAKDARLDPIARAPFDATGRIGAAIQASSHLVAGDTFDHSRLTLVRNPAKPKYHLLTIRVGALAEGRSLVFPLKLDRPFPVGARIKRAAVQRIRNGHRFAWQAIFTLEMPQAVNRDPSATGYVGIDVGWRREEGGLRVATHNGRLANGAEKTGELIIDTLRSFEYADAVRGFRDVAFQDACAYAKAATLAGAEHATQWKDKARLMRLQARHPTDLGLAWWRARDRHLEDIECGAREKAIRRRLDTFRCYADALARRYRGAVLEDMPMTTWVGTGETSTRERARSVAALSILQNAIVHRFGPGRVAWVPAEDSTRTCHACGTVRATAVGKPVWWTCEDCGQEHHQDANAAIILRRRGEHGGGNETRGPARVAKGGKGKRKMEKKVKSAGGVRAKEITAREPVANAAE